MNEKNFRQIDDENELIELLKKHGLFRVDDVTFDDLADGNMYVYTGNDFAIDADMLSEMEISALLVVGSVDVDYVAISDILSDFGVFCVTGDVRCKDFNYATESTGVVVGGDLIIEQVFYADCGNSVLQVNKNCKAKLFFDSQCSIDIRGKKHFDFDDTVTAAQLKETGITVSKKQSPDQAVNAYFEKYE